MIVCHDNKSQGISLHLARNKITYVGNSIINIKCKTDCYSLRGKKKIRERPCLFFYRRGCCAILDIKFLFLCSMSNDKIEKWFYYCSQYDVY